MLPKQELAQAVLPQALEVPLEVVWAPQKTPEAMVARARALLALAVAVVRPVQIILVAPVALLVVLQLKAPVVVGPTMVRRAMARPGPAGRAVVAAPEQAVAPMVATGATDFLTHQQRDRRVLMARSGLAQAPAAAVVVVVVLMEAREAVVQEAPMERAAVVARNTML